MKILFYIFEFIGCMDYIVIMWDVRGQGTYYGRRDIFKILTTIFSINTDVLNGMKSYDSSW